MSPVSEVIPCHPVVVFERNSKGEVPTTRRGVGFTAFDFFCEPCFVMSCGQSPVTNWILQRAFDYQSLMSLAFSCYFFKLRPFGVHQDKSKFLRSTSFHVFLCLICSSQPQICRFGGFLGLNCSRFAGYQAGIIWLQDSQQNCIRWDLKLAAMNMKCRRWHPCGRGHERPYFKPFQTSPFFHGVLCLFQTQPQQL